MPALELTFHSGEDSLSVRRFSVREALSAPFRADVWAVSSNQDIDFSSIVGKPAQLRVLHGTAHVLGLGERVWRGVCSSMAQAQSETTGLATYELTIVPTIALLAHRRDHRIFQHESIVDIVKEILADWRIPAAWQIEPGKYPRLENRVQHGESDLDFVSRLLAEAGIAYRFDDRDEGVEITLSDQLHAVDPRPMPPIPFVDNPNRAAEKEYVTRVDLAREVRPAVHVVRDYDFRNPGYPVLGRAEAAAGDARLEQYGYAPGEFLIEEQKGGATPVADQQGIARHNETWAADSVERGLWADRLGERSVSYETNVVGLRPGTVFSMTHPHGSLDARRLLATDLALDGTAGGEWIIAGRAVLAEVPYRPVHRTPRPSVRGLQSAIVVGPAGQEIHSDEFGRVRVRFLWDRSGVRDDKASCWLRVSQGWAGAGFGWTALPRVGHEVLVAFFEDDPDQPVIVGGAFNGANPHPYSLPPHATASLWQSRSSPGADGFNEIFLDDAARRELFYLQAQQDFSQLVVRNEVGTIARNAARLVKGNEAQTTAKKRLRITRGERRKLLKGDHSARIEGRQSHRVAASHDLRVVGSTRTLMDGNADLIVHGEERVKVAGTDSAVASEDRHDLVLKRHALETGSEIHLLSKDSAVLEGVRSITFKTPGGFVLIDAGGVTIKGTLVKINSGGIAGTGAGSSPEAPEPPREVERFDPPMPLGETNPDGDEPARGPIEALPPPPARPVVELTWIEIVLKDADGKGVGGERYKVITPDGKTRYGNLDGEGKARIEKIVPGECQVTFPDLDRDDWK